MKSRSNFKQLGHARRRRPARKPRRERGGVSELAEELGPFALSLARHLIRKKARCLAALERGEHLQLSGLHFVVLHTKGGAVRWFKVSRVEEASASD